MKRLTMTLAIVSLLAATQGRAQTPAPQSAKQPLYTITINVVDRTTKAINYQHRNGSTTIDFKGTVLMPAAKGEAKVESKQGYTEVEVEFDRLQPASRFGPEFLTYVLWAITPEGRATNMGEIILNGTKSKLDVTTELQSFGLVVTAEPYFAVSQPSDAVVMENVVRKDTVGKVEEIDAKYQLLQRGQYTVNVPPAELKPIQLDKNTPLDLYQARNAVQIAKWAGADISAADSFDKASKLLAQAEGYKTTKAGSKPIAMAARQAVQTAEDARLITLKNQADARLDRERAASAGREATANASAAGARADANDAERARAAAQTETDRARADASVALRERAAAQAQTDRARADANDADRARAAAQAQTELARADANAAERARALAQAETDRIRLEAQFAAQRSADEAKALAERTKVEAELTAQRVADEAKALAERSRVDAELAAQRVAKDKEAVEAANQLARNSAAEQSQREKQELRNKLVLQLNTILQTRDSPRGLVVNMSDVLFDSGQFSLKPGAREKLSRISGIVLAYPSLKLEVEGHTDGVGSDQLNMRLSDNRANSVRDFLIKQGIVTSSIAARGLGESQPVATNDTAAGRQQNRRVELVVSGDVIGANKATIDASAQR